MFQDVFATVGKLLADIGLIEKVDENATTTGTDSTDAPDAPDANPEREHVEEHNEGDSSSVVAAAVEEASEGRLIHEPTQDVTVKSPETEFEAAALQVPAVTSDDDDEDENDDQSSSPVETKAASNINMPADSASEQELHRQESINMPHPLLAPQRDERLSARSHDAGLDANSAHISYVGRASLTPPPRKSSSHTHHHHRRTSSNTESSYSTMSLATAEHLHASWTNAISDPDDPLSFLATAGFTGMDNSLGSNRPLPVSRLSSNASATSGPTLVSSSSFMGDESFNSMGVSSAIHDAARITDWETVKDFCEQDPEAAKFVGRDRWTALHHACNRRCPKADVVEALIRANPDALLLEAEKGWYPLHYACRFKAPKEVVRLLVHLFPGKGKKAVQKQESLGRTPLYYAVRYDAPPGVVGILLNADASVVLEEDQNADSPLGLVWDAWAEKLEGKRTLQRIHGTINDEETAQDRALRVQKRLQSQSKVLERWKNVNVFLKAAFGFRVDDEDDDAEVGNGRDEEEKKDSNPFLPQISVDDNRKWRILHAAAAIKCHASLFQLACALHPEQALELDENDLQGPSHIQGGWQTATHLSALHLAASSLAHGDTGKTVIQKLLYLNPSAAEAKDSTGSLPLHRIAENKSKSHWLRDGALEIYEANTSAVRLPDSEGRLPLHRAATAMVAQGEATDETTIARSNMCNLLDLYPDASAHSDDFGRLPLHFSVQHGTTWGIQLQLLHDQFPEAVRSRTGVKLGNMLPLHMASSNSSAEPCLIKKLVELHPRAASQAHRGGKFPLHFACETGLSWESVRAIHEANPEAVRQAEQNPRGWTALHMAAASKRANHELIENLLQLNPDAALVADTRGRYALHLACISGKSWDGGLSDLFVANPDAISSADQMGLLPFYLVCFRYCGPSGRWSLDETTNPPVAVTEAPKKHHRRNSSRVSIEAIQREQAKEAAAARHLDIIFNLLRADPTVIA
jgi:ankyrin repeat protein